ncbi:hypothetical protein GMORB2_1672 [Geosmithia morbida]|uniref:Clr5 domain-containing protein n=1 Tax=Geosmithia morbida TaxID=1094350 RepID=A0A9P5D0P0_9HYPO|nr:uncharacterized protein GMORB2_1672 [Geosmithia morbida]KAF4121832.1 hypothetical protein GMORB2_1672 [Geosmithia morbida]
MLARQWAELNAFAASFGLGAGNNDDASSAGNGLNPDDGNDSRNAHPGAQPPHHQFQHEPSQHHHRHHHQPQQAHHHHGHGQGPTVGTLVLPEYAGFDFDPQQDWSRFAFDGPDTPAAPAVPAVPAVAAPVQQPQQQQQQPLQHQQQQAGHGVAGPQLVHHHHHHHHHHVQSTPSGFASDAMDWTPTQELGTDFASNFGSGSLQQPQLQDATATIKMEPDYAHHRSNGVLDPPSSSAAHHQHQTQHRQPPLRSRPTGTPAMTDGASPMPMPMPLHQQPSSPPPQQHPHVIPFGTFDAAVGTASHPAPFGAHSFADAGPHVPTADDIFGSLDGFVAQSSHDESSHRHHHHHHHMSASPMASSPAPATPAPATAVATPGFASWAAPVEQHHQPQTHPTNPFHQHLTPQPYTPNPYTSQPSPVAGGHPGRVTSPGGGYFPPCLPSTPMQPSMTPEPKLKESTPQPSGSGSRPHAREQVSAESWEEHKAVIHDLYLEQRKPLKEVMAIMAEKHNFHATPKMYKTRFSQWGFVKNNTEDEVKKLLSMKFQRDAEGKVSEFVRNGKIINLGTYLKRKGVTEYDLVDFELPVDLPSHIRCRTPTPPPAPDYLGTPDLVRAQELVVTNMRKAFLQCRQWETETSKAVGWTSTMVWGAPSSEMLTEANFYFEAGDADSGGQCLMNAFNQLEMDLKQLSPQAMMEMLLGMVRRDAGLMTALCKYVAAFATTNYDRSHPLRQILTCLYEVQQKHGAMMVSELLWGSAPMVAEELEAIYGRRHPYAARTWIDLALFYDQRDGERLERLAAELREQHKQMERRKESSEPSDLLALRYAVCQLLYAARPTSDECRKAAKDLVKYMKKEKLLFRVRDSRPNVFCYHCAVKNDPWTKRCRRRYDSVVEMLEKHADVKILPYFEEDFHTADHHDEPEASSAWSAVMGQPVPTSRWRFL